MNGEFSMETAYIDGTPVPVCNTCGALVPRAKETTHLNWHAVIQEILTGSPPNPQARRTSASHSFWEK